MKPELYIARRFAFKQRSASKPTFIVFIAVTGIAVGTAALILTLSIVKGFSSQVEEKLIGFNSHFQVRQGEGSLFFPLAEDTVRLEKLSNVVSVSPFLEKNVILQGGAGDVSLSHPAMIKGVPGDEPPGFLSGAIVEGGWFGQGEDPETLEILVGKPLAQALQLTPGSRVMIISASSGDSGALVDARGDILDLLSSLGLEIATVSGVYETGLNEGFDDYMVIAELGRMQRLFSEGRTRISGYEVMVRDLAGLDTTSMAAVDALGAPFYSFTVYERFANLFEWLKLQQNITPLLIITITVVAVFNIISTLLVLIIEKTREIGMLGALGLSPGRISGIFLTQAVLVSLAGILAGNLLAFGFSVFELRFHLISLPQKNYFIKHVPIEIVPADYLLVSCIVGALTLAFAFIPARVSASLKPGTALLT
ncbi:hypothetical protein CHL67_06045 [Prosthecochloris sp. GSB1]|uniref:ABC transporter permease n=1 Tax=Prosthecochloris sp. GSB1 TaxID=281093 RepID=UPI000B8CBE12|nr:ABC transporter permease [Prosthecochloris sp. GSB1]ASQ90536.1 hypothetical protein CHL67_06045 [Prosthecochloris sp. GSB1]